MSTTDAALISLSLIGSGLLAGVLFGVAVGVLPAFASVSAQQYVSLHRVIGVGFDRVMPRITAVTTALDVIAAFGVAGPVRGLLLTAAVLQAGVALISQLGNVPINRAVRALPEGALAAGWSDPRGRWRRWHLLRTSLALGALAAHAVVLVTLT